ncbi:MAG: oligosaccharide flippase family protein [Bacteroidota bacterium]
MHRAFLSNIVLLVTINLLIKPLYIFGIDRTVQNVVGLEQYGIYFELLGFTLLFNILNDLGVQNFTSRHIAQHGHLLHKYFPNLLTLKVLAGLSYMGLALGIGLSLGYTRLHFWLLFVLLLNQIIIGLVQFFRANIIGLGQYRTDSLLSVLDRCLMIALCGALLLVPQWRNEFQITHFVYAHTFSLCLTLLVSFALLRRHLHQLRFRWNLKLVLVLIRQSLPYALIILLNTAYNRTDALMLGQLYSTGTQEVGIYASAYRLLEAAMMFALLFGNLLVPMFSKMLKSKQSVVALVRLSFEVLSAGAITATVAVVVFRAEIMNLLYTADVPYASDVLAYLMLGFIAASGTFIWGALLVAAGELRSLNKIYFGGFVTNVLLNFMLIPEYGAIGAAIATLGTQIVVLAAKVIISCQLLNFHIWSSLVKLTIFGALLCSIAYIVQAAPLQYWLFGFVSVLVAGGILAFLTKLIQVKSLKGLLAEK